MKTRILKTILLLLTICNLNTIYSQAPQKISYQAVIRNASNTLLSNTTVGMRITIKGASSDSSYYAETQTVTTNSNGLATLQIGEGKIISGTIEGIKWGDGPYTIFTDTDPTGGNNYTISGSSELLSVPYSLFSANGTPGATGPQGPIGLTGATGAVGPQGPIGATGATGGYPVHFIGESYGGGIVFFVYDGGQHGLIAATTNQSDRIAWYNGGTFRATSARGDGLGAGAMNTTMIVAAQLSDDIYGNFAAKFCADYSVVVGGITYGDWYLPSYYELNLLCLQKVLLGISSSTGFWSSTESDNSQVFINGAGCSKFIISKGTTNAVRAIRAF